MRTIKKKRKGKSSELLNEDITEIQEPRALSCDSPSIDRVERSLEQHRENLLRFEELRKSLEEDLPFSKESFQDPSRKKGSGNFSKSALRAEIKVELDEISPYSSKSSKKQYTPAKNPEM